MNSKNTKNKFKRNTNLFVDLPILKIYFYSFFESTKKTRTHIYIYYTRAHTHTHTQDMLCFLFAEFHDTNLRVHVILKLLQ